MYMAEPTSSACIFPAAPAPNPRRPSSCPSRSDSSRVCRTPSSYSPPRPSLPARSSSSGTSRTCSPTPSCRPRSPRSTGEPAVLRVAAFDDAGEPAAFLPPSSPWQPATVTTAASAAVTANAPRLPTDALMSPTPVFSVVSPRPTDAGHKEDTPGQGAGDVPHESHSRHSGSWGDVKKRHSGPCRAPPHTPPATRAARPGQAASPSPSPSLSPPSPSPSLSVCAVLILCVAGGTTTRTGAASYAE